MKIITSFDALVEENVLFWAKLLDMPTQSCRYDNQERQPGQTTVGQLANEGTCMYIDASRLELSGINFY